MAYVAELQIAVKGAKELLDFQRQLNKSSEAVDRLNRDIKTLSEGGVVKSINNLNALLQQAAENFNSVELNTKEATTAAREYVKATDQLNTELRERLKLLAQINREERANALVRAGVQVPSQRGPLLLAPARPGAPEIGGGARRRITGAVERLGGARTEDQAAMALRYAQALREQVRPLSQIDALFAGITSQAQKLQSIKALPDANTLNASARGIKQLETAEDALNRERAESVARLDKIARLEESRERRAKKLNQIAAYEADLTQATARAAFMQTMPANFGLKTSLALPSSADLNAAGRGIKQLETAEDRLNRERSETIEKLQRIDRLEESRTRRAKKLQAIADYEAGTTPAVTTAGGRTGGLRGRAGGAISSAIIGGGFPLLFGQGPAAATGGALGGLAGGLLGGGFGFALSIAGTALGDLITNSEALDKSLAQLNSSLNVTGSTSVTTAADIKQLAKDLSITNEEATALVGTFSQFGDAQTREALASLFGGVGGAATFEAIARAGISEKDALGSIFELRKIIGNEAATQLALQLKAVGATDAQATLLKLVVDRSIQNSVAAATSVKYTDQLLSIWENIVAGVAGALSLAVRFIAKLQEGTLIKLPFLDQVAKILGGVKGRTAKEIADQRGENLRKRLQADIDAARKALQQETSTLSTQSALTEAMKPGRKPPEDRTAQLVEELNALRQIGEAEDRIRDLQFQGRDIAVLAAEETKVLADIERDRNKALLSANYASEKALIIQIASQRIENLRLETADKERALRQKRFEEELQAEKAIKDSVQQYKNIRLEQQLQAQYSKDYYRLVQEGVLPAEAERIANFNKLVKQQLLLLDEEILSTKVAIERAKLDGLRTVELEKQLKILQGQRDAVAGEAAAGPGAGPTDKQRLTDIAAQVRGELNALIDPVNQINAAADSIAESFSNAFKGLVSGATSAREALASFFQSVADYFLDMAAQIIKKWLQMIILNQILRIFTGAASSTPFSGGSSALSFDPSGFATDPGISWGFAKGGAFARNGIVPFAYGGIVNSPTLFKFANGGAMRTGIMGEAGPEAILPLSRGANGRLGVEAAGNMGATNIVVNVDASGSSVQGNDQDANQLGRVIAAAVQQELIKQKRPGGLLTR